MKKKILAMLLACVTAFGAMSYAADVNILKNDRTMVPVRGIFEAAGAKVNWDAETQTVMIAKSEGEEITFIFLQVGSDTAFVNSEATTLDVPAEISNDRTMVPLRFIMEELGAVVTWDPDTKTVSITKGE